MSAAYRETLYRVSEAVGRARQEVAHRNELTIAYVRVLVAGAATAVQIVAAFVPFEAAGGRTLPPAMPLFAMAFFTWSVVVTLVLRRMRGARATPYVLATADAFILVTEHVLAWPVMSVVPFGAIGMSASYATTCSMMAASGLLRSAPGATGFTAVMGVGAFVVGMMAVAPGAAAGILFATLLLTGTVVFTFRVTGVVRRALEGELARATLQRFLPRSVLEAAHGDPAELLAPRSLDATLLMSDLRGFTSLSETMEPPALLEFLSEVQSAFAAEVYAHGGLVDKYLGDGMLAVFGLDDEGGRNHARQAVDAAFAMLRAVERINERRAAAGMKPVHAGVGVHSGTIVCGCLGGPDRLEFTVLGDTVNTASRLEGLTKQFEVDLLVSGETAARLPRTDPLVPLGETEVRGRATKLAVFGYGGKAGTRATA